MTAGFHFYRGVPVDGWIFLGAGIVLGADVGVAHARMPEAMSTRWKPIRPGRGPLLVSVLAGIGAMVVVAVVPPGSPGIPAVLGIVGAAMLVLAWPENSQPKGPRERGATRPNRASTSHHADVPVRRAAWWWGAVLLFLALWELGSYFTDELDPAEAPAVPPLTDLLQPLFDSDASRWLMMLVWLGACASLLRVARRP